MENSGTGHTAHPTDLARFWQAVHDKKDTPVKRRCTFMAARWPGHGAGPAAAARLPKNEPKTATFAAKKSQLRAAARDKHLSAGIPAHFGDNAINGIVAF
jgi:hypothetical protein